MGKFFYKLGIEEAFLNVTKNLVKGPTKNDIP